MNLFGEEYEAPQNECCQQNTKKLKGKKNTTTKAKNKLDEEIPARNIQVKMYNDFYHYEAPAELQKPTLEHIRKWMIEKHGFTELFDPNRAGLMVVTPEGEGEDPYIYCGIKFEKMG